MRASMRIKPFITTLLTLPVLGRVLNQLSGGYAVGVAGLVCFLPAMACHPSTASRIGQLQVRACVGAGCQA